MSDFWISAATRKYDGAWDELHGMTASGVSDALKAAAGKHYGHAGREFLRHLAADGQDFREALAATTASPPFTVADGQGRRGARRLAIVGMAELATQYGLTGWCEGEAMAAAVELFQKWHAARGAGPSEAVADFTRQVGRSWSGMGTPDFPVPTPTPRESATARAGGEMTGEAESFCSTAQGYGRPWLGMISIGPSTTCRECGALIDCGSAKRSKSQRIGGRVVRLYTIDPTRLEANHAAE
ncbi:MAG: hypothetical protein U5K56_09945 [Halioglobus sp.]|nr:hypothetical protein [Halioglobus sp.]